MCCEKCFHLIAKADPAASKAWMHLCKVSCEFPGAIIVAYDRPNFRTLERMGFILTTEKGDDDSQIIIKLMGQREAASGFFFCKDEGHD